MWFAGARSLPLLLLPCCLALEPWHAPSAAISPGLGLPSGAEASGAVRLVSDETSVSDEQPLSRAQMFKQWNALRGDPYALDDRERWVSDGRRVSCERGALVSYQGTSLRYQGALLINPAFQERLSRFESLAAEVAREVYGREPRRIVHYGSFSCRSTRKRSRLVSEHAFGNALDLVGFDFAPAKKTEPLDPALPRSLKNSFQVRVARHWSASTGVGATHARFLAELTRRLSERSDIFRSMFGPGHGGHDDHLHLDVSPWRYVDL